MVGSWSLPGRGQAGWNTFPPLCQSDVLLPPCAYIAPGMALFHLLCLHTGLDFSGTACLPCGSWWCCRWPWSPRRWCSASWATSVQSRCSCVYLCWLNKCNTHIWSFHTFWSLDVFPDLHPASVHWGQLGSHKDVSQVGRSKVRHHGDSFVGSLFGATYSLFRQTPMRAHFALHV